MGKHSMGWRDMGRQPTASRPIERGQAGGAAAIGAVAQGVLVAVVAVAMFGLVDIYSHGLRDPRYLDGWLLAGGIGLQLGYHAALKSAVLSAASARRWRHVHILTGYLLVAVFLSHTDFSLPDTGLEWALWTGFVAVSLSGIVGTYLAWSFQARRRTDDAASPERIAVRRKEIAQRVQAIVAETGSAAPQLPLPGLPHDDWVKDLYATRLREFFQGQQNAVAHLVGSERPLKRLTDEVDALARYVDQPSQERLALIRQMVVEKDRLDALSVQLGLARVWLLVHVPATYAMIVLSIFHVVVVYAFSSGDW